MTSTILPASDRTGRIAAWRIGCGPDVVLIHGVGLCAQAWEGVATRLAPSFTVHAPDMPGHGGSPLDGAATLDDYVDRIAAYLRTLDAPVGVAGHSMGAMIAIELAARVPERVAALAALNAIYRRSPEAVHAVQARAAALPGDAVADPSVTLARWFGENPEGAAFAARAACQSWLTTVDPAGYKAAYSVFAHADGPSDDALRGLTCPAVFLTGEDDPNSTPAMSRALAHLVPGGRAVSVARAAHMLPMTHPEQTARVIAETIEHAGHEGPGRKGG